MNISTRSRIGIINKDGSIESIYCHYDGYIEGVGNILNNHYKDINRIRSLISLGDISHIEKNITPNPNFPHEFGDNEQQDVTVAYHRDRNEEWEQTKPKKDENIGEFNNRCLGGWEE